MGEWLILLQGNWEGFREKAWAWQERVEFAGWKKWARASTCVLMKNPLLKTHSLGDPRDAKGTWWNLLPKQRELGWAGEAQQGRLQPPASLLCILSMSSTISQVPFLLTTFLLEAPFPYFRYLHGLLSPFSHPRKPARRNGSDVNGGTCSVVCMAYVAVTPLLGIFAFQFFDVWGT